MIFFWSGWGIAVPLILAATLAVSVVSGLDRALGEPWNIIIFCTVSALIIYATGRRLNRKRPDEPRQACWRLRGRHAFFWLAVEWWALLPLLFLAVYAYWRFFPA